MTTASREIQNDGEFITSVKTLTNMLKNLSQQATPATLHPSDSALTLSTYIAYIDTENAQVYYDEPLPSNRLSLLKNRPVTLTMHYNGCLLTIRDMYLEPAESKDDDDSLYVSNLPTEAHYLQRRRSFRAQVRPMLDIFSNLQLAEDTHLRGRLRDISVEGCRIEYPGELTSNMALPDEVCPLPITLPDNSTLVLKVVPLRIQQTDSREKSFIGCRFDQLSPGEMQQVSSLVNDLQRDYINYMRPDSNADNIPDRFKPKPKFLEQYDAQQALDKKTAQTLKQTSSAKNSSHTSPESSADLQQDDASHARVTSACEQAEATLKLALTHVRQRKHLPWGAIRKAAATLLQCLKDDRQALILYSRLRSVEQLYFQHSLSFAITLTDSIASQYKDKVGDEMLIQLMIGGLCHDLPRALMPGGLQNTDLDIDYEQVDLFQNLHKQIMDEVSAEFTPKNEAFIVIRDCHERMNGKGLPAQREDSTLNSVAKLTSMLYAYVKLSYAWENQRCYFHPIHAIKEVNSRHHEFHQSSLKLVVRQHGKYPLGCAVELSDSTVGFILRKDDTNQPTLIRKVYDLSSQSRLAPVDIFLPDTDLWLEKPVNPIKLELDTGLLLAPSSDRLTD